VTAAASEKRKGASAYTVLWTETALKMLESVSDARVRQNLFNRAGGLKNEPEKQGKSLTGELAGFRSIRAVGQRFRIIYQVNRREVLVYIAAVGRRQQRHKSDIYALASKLLKHGLVR
jgi:mRNA interferase RelE/StbE